MKILGISAYYHDAAAALIIDGQIAAAAQEERFTRIKHDPAFPENAIAYCLSEANLQLEELDAIVFYDKPFLKFERILQTVLDTAPRGLIMFLRSMPVWLNEKLFLKSEIKKHLKEMAGKKIKVPILFSTHHMSHAASAYYASPYQEAAVLTIDGVGEWATASIAHASGPDVTLLKEMHFPHSLGLLYASVTAFLGFKVNEGEYKVMGLAPYANPEDELVKKYYDLFIEHIVSVSDDGSIKLNPAYFSYTYAERMVPVNKWECLFDLKQRQTDTELNNQHAALAMALQWITEDTVLKMAAYAKELTGCKNLCLAGGVALNCVANGKLQAENWFENIYVQPASGDAGGALGAALAVYHQHFGKERTVYTDFMKSSALGPKFSDAQIEKALHETDLDFIKLAPDETLYKTAQALAEGKVVGWFSGRMEFGPRALGYRSILADAANPTMQRTLNLKIKKRESFRPFAPIFLEEELSEYFKDAKPNPYMLFVYPIKESKQIKRPHNFYKLPFSQMLAIPGSSLPAITHIDYTARIQTVPPESNAPIRKLLEQFKKNTGRGILINTSFNIKDEPIVCTPSDAIRCFLSTEMDVLVLENYWILKNK